MLTNLKITAVAVSLLSVGFVSSLPNKAYAAVDCEVIVKVYNSDMRFRRFAVKNAQDAVNEVMKLLRDRPARHVKLKSVTCGPEY